MRYILALMLVFISLPARADLLFPDMALARNAEQAGDFQTAAAHWEDLSEFGIPEAYYKLAELYADGKGVTKNETRAFTLAAQSADAGLPRAYLLLGRLYEDGRGTEKNLAQAQIYFTRAADAGDARGAYHLGRLYERNPDVVPAAAPMAPAPRVLLDKIESGQLAFAEELAHRYADGKRGKDKEAALLYMTIASRNGSSSAAGSVETLKQGMDEKSIRRAEKAAGDMIARIRAPGFVEAGRRAKYTTAGRDGTNSALLVFALPERNNNFRAAAEEYKKAVDHGYLRAARNLAQLYEKGRGVKEDKAQALTYYYVARDSGIETAAQTTMALETALAPQDIARARSNADTILSAHAKPVKNDSNFQTVGIVKAMATLEENTDLGTRSDTMENGFGIDARAGISYTPSPDMRLYGEMRGFKSTGVITTRDDDNDDAMSAGYIELRQFWAEFYNLFDTPLLSAKIGRQRFREDRGMWWNDDLDAVRLSLDSTLTSGFIAAGQSLDNYRIGEDDEFSENEKSRLRVLGEMSRLLSPSHTLEGRFLYEHDHSGTDNTGAIVNASNWDREDFDLLWLGIRAKGDIPAGENADISYRIDGAIVTGEETITATTPGPGGGQRTIAGTQDRDVFGWAVDGGVDVALTAAPLSPTLSIGYTHGSGDNGTGSNGAFRQTDMHGNTSSWADRAGEGRNRHYGEVLRPELSNIHILSLGAQIPVMEESMLALGYFNYWLDEETGGLRSPGITAPLNATDTYLGQAADLTLFMPLYNEQLSSRFIIGGFKAGDAFGAAEDEYGWRGTAELRFKF